MTRRNSRGRRTTVGFTLIELMIVVAVVGILAAVAYPSYSDSVRKGRRGQAKADLMELAQLAERHRTVNNTYAGFVLPFAQTPREGGTTHYLLTLDTASVDALQLKATAKGDQAKDKCGDLSLNQAGTKVSSKGATAECW